MTFEERIDLIAQLLSQLYIPYSKVQCWDGWQLRFGWTNGDVACHSNTNERHNGMVETYCFPWDKGKVTALPPTEAALYIIAHYANWLGVELEG